MLELTAGEYRVWDAFSLVLERDIRFCVGRRYRLDGSNGSGKSSFLQKLLLPEVKRSDAWHVLYLQQQMHMQLFAIRAWAAVYHPGQVITSEADVWKLMWEELSMLDDATPVMLIADEAHEIIIPEHLKRPLCVVFSSHSYHMEEAETISFQPCKGGCTSIIRLNLVENFV